METATYSTPISPDPQDSHLNICKQCIPNPDYFEDKLINSLKNPIRELQLLALSYDDNEGLEINNSQDLENLIEQNEE